MNRKIVVFILLFTSLGILASQKLTAMEIPVLNDVYIESIIEYDENENLFKYSYLLSNPATNTGLIWSVDIDISKPQHGRDISADGLIIIKGISRSGRVVQDTFRDEIADIGLRMDKQVIPVGIDIPAGWMGGIALRGTASWGSREEEYNIKPGGALDGFIIKSRGIPTIREISIKPWWVYVAEGYVSEEDEEKARRIEEEITYHGKTVGPTAPPEELVPVDFLQQIIGLKHEAAALGWITNKGIERSLDAKLEAALKKLEQGNNVAARDIIGAFINEVEAQGCESYDGCPEGRHLAPEAYALLKYNAQYLIDNLER